jgi:hypothetical protein
MSDMKKSVSAAGTDIKKTTTGAAKPVDAVKKAAASVKASVAPKAEEAAKEAEKPVEEAKKMAEELKTEIKSEVAKAATAAKKTVAAAKKTATKKKTTVRKTAARAAKAESKMNSAVYIQFNDLNISSEGLVTRVKEIWAAKGNDEKDLKDVKVYVNVAESKAYYVVNEDVFGEFDL